MEQEMDHAKSQISLIADISAPKVVHKKAQLCQGILFDKTLENRFLSLMLMMIPSRMNLEKKKTKSLYTPLSALPENLRKTSISRSNDINTTVVYV